MMTYFNLHRPDSERLLGDCSEAAPGLGAQIEILPCPITKEHVAGSRRVGPLYVQVKHNRRDELMIWCWGPGCLVHEQLLGDFAQQGFTGYQIRPATVRFRDGSTSVDYRELIVTGWAGMAAPESGIRVVKSCPACLWKTYSAFNDIESLIDWTQWTGDDFFIVWPLPLFTLVTERVAQFLLSRKVKSFVLRGLGEIDPFVLKFGFGPGRLSDYFPEDLAIKYGKPLGIE